MNIVKLKFQGNHLVVTFSTQGRTSAIDVPVLSKHCLDRACDSPAMHSSEQGLQADQGDQLLLTFLWIRRFSIIESKIIYIFRLFA